MAHNLVIIEAPGKRKIMADVLWRSGIRDVEVMATVGHIGTNPNGFKPIGIDATYSEVAYRLKPEKERLAADMRLAASQASQIYLATDDDQEGDVIARDVLRFCIDDEDHSKVLRLRLRALAPSEVKVALAEAAPLEPLDAARGDSRRVLDRLIGALSNDSGAIGRVQGSLLLMLQQQVPVVGTATYTMAADDDKGPWIATVPIFAGQEIPSTDALQVDIVAACGRSQTSTLRRRVMNHDDILLAASLELKTGVSEVSNVMQSLYERGSMTYPRAKDHAITQEAFRRLMATSKMNGVGFDESCFMGLRDRVADVGHEAPNAMVLDLPLNRDLKLLTMEEQVLVVITRALSECGIRCQLETPRLMDLGTLPSELGKLNWHRVIPTGDRLWEVRAPSAEVTKWTQEQSLLHFMSKNELGRPSTIIHHLGKFLERGLVDESFELTSKGRDWCYNVGEIFGHQNISKMVENYIENNVKPSNEMVAEMIQICGLEKVDTTIQHYERLQHDNEELEVSSGDFSEY